MLPERRTSAFSMRCTVAIAPATTRPGSTLRQLSANRIRSGVITLKEAQMNLKLLRFLVVSLAAAMSLTVLAAVLAQLTQTGTETAASSLLSRTALAQTAPKAKNVVLVHGLFADGSSWSEVIPRLQAAGLNGTSVQNPLTTLPEAVDASLRVLGRQNGPTVLAGHSFSGMIVTEAGVHPNVSALVYVAARAPDAGEDYAALAKQFPTPPASAGIVFDGD